MKLSDAEKMVTSLMKFHGVSDYSFGWMSRRGKFNLAGDCSWKKKEIRLQPMFVEWNQPFIVKQTILHEIAHALTPKHSHNKFWKKAAISIGCFGKRQYGKEVKRRARLP